MQPSLMCQQDHTVQRAELVGGSGTLDFPFIIFHLPFFIRHPSVVLSLFTFLAQGSTVNAENPHQ